MEKGESGEYNSYYRKEALNCVGCRRRKNIFGKHRQIQRYVELYLVLWLKTTMACPCKHRASGVRFRRVTAGNLRSVEFIQKHFSGKGPSGLGLISLRLFWAFQPLLYCIIWYILLL